MGITHITVRGARQHNLKNVNVSIPRNTLTVVTGLSGSGKSSLAFDTIYAEGQRRYVETLSAYARQFLDQMERPDVDAIDGLSRRRFRLSRRRLRGHLGLPWGRLRRFTTICGCCMRVWGSRIVRIAGRPISRQSADQIVERIVQLAPGERITISGADRAWAEGGVSGGAGGVSISRGSGRASTGRWWN